jgi:hypothetical protein
MTSPSAPPESPSNGRPRLSGGLLFRSPEPTTVDDLTQTPTWEEAGEGSPDPLDLLGGSPSASASSSDASDEDDESDPRSSGTSSADPASVKALSTKAQKLAARQAVKIAGGMAHQYLARDEAAQAAGLFLVDDESAEQIADPLARIMARHAPVDGAMTNPDVADGIAAMLGVANFVRKQIEASSHAAALRVQAAPTSPAADV